MSFIVALASYLLPFSKFVSILIETFELVVGNQRSPGLVAWYMEVILAGSFKVLYLTRLSSVDRQSPMETRV